MFAADAVRCIRRGNGGGGDIIMWSNTDKTPNITLSEDKTTATVSSNSPYLSFSGVGVSGDYGRNTGAWHIEFTMLSISANDYKTSVGLSPVASNRASNLGQYQNSVGYCRNSEFYLNNFYLPGKPSYAVGDRIGMSVDFDSGTVMFWKNGVSLGADAFSISSDLFYVPSFSGQLAGSSVKILSPPDFAYPVPAGYEAWV